MAENQELFESNAHEKRRHSSYLVPYSYYESRIPDYFPFVPLHWHREWELNYVTDGEGIMRIGDREAEVHPGDILLIQPEVLHAIEADGCLCYDTVVFRTEMLGSSEDPVLYRNHFSSLQGNSKAASRSYRQSLLPAVKGMCRAYYFLREGEPGTD